MSKRVTVRRKKKGAPRRRANTRNGDCVTDNGARRAPGANTRNADCVTDDDRAGAAPTDTRNTVDCYQCVRVLDDGEEVFLEKGLWFPNTLCKSCAHSNPAPIPYDCLFESYGEFLTSLGSSPCRICGRMFYRPSGGREFYACSRDCAKAYNDFYQREGRKPYYKTICETCGGDFQGTRSDARYCSSRCRQKAYRQRGKAT